ncbi:MAG TPA: hypothetical protein VGA81_01760, partial [Methylomirabilota bacterium]
LDLGQALRRPVQGTSSLRMLGPRTVALAVFFVVNSILLNVVLAVLPWTPQGKTVFNYTARAIIGRAQSDSWGQMHTPVSTPAHCSPRSR